MKYEANIYQMVVEDHSFWVAESKALKGCVGQGETSEEAIKELEQNEIEWLETAAEMNIPIPQPVAKNTNMHSGKFALRLSPYVYDEAYDIANELGISLNQYFNNAIVNYIAESKRYVNKSVAEHITYDMR